MAGSSTINSEISTLLIMNYTSTRQQNSNGVVGVVPTWGTTPNLHTRESLHTGENFDFALLVQEQRLIPERDVAELRSSQPDTLIVSISYFLPSIDSPTDQLLRRTNPDVRRTISNIDVIEAIAAQLKSANISSAAYIIPNKL